MKDKTMKNWADERYLSLGNEMYPSLETVGLTPLLKQAMRNGKQLHHTSTNGNIEVDQEHFSKYLQEQGGKLLYQHNDHSLWIWEDSMVSLAFGAGRINMDIASLREDFAKQLADFSTKLFVPVNNRGNVFAITYNHGALVLSNMGNAGIPLVETNYTDQVLSDYKFVVEELNSTTPSGRLTILEGTPGGGKTFMVRALLNDVEHGMFVLVAPDMISKLGGPELLPLLIQYHNAFSGPIILILEDADKCLVARSNGDSDLSLIQSVLNLGDGIMGSLLDIRVIATTNAKKFEMDTAILRRGRLSRQVYVGSLDTNSAKRAYSALLPNKPIPIDIIKAVEISLADVYGLARDNGWRPATNSSDDE